MCCIRVSVNAKLKNVNASVIISRSFSRYQKRNLLHIYTSNTRKITVVNAPPLITSIDKNVALFIHYNTKEIPRI